MMNNDKNNGITMMNVLLNYLEWNAVPRQAWTCCIADVRKLKLDELHWKLSGPFFRDINYTVKIEGFDSESSHPCSLAN